MRVAFGTDERAEVTEAIKAELSALGHEVVVIAEGDAWPDVAKGVARAVAGGAADRGIVCCWTGTGVAMAANKVRGVRAALCVDAQTAAGARRWNDANVMAVSIRLTTPVVARELLQAFFETDVAPGEEAQIAKLEA